MNIESPVKANWFYTLNNEKIKFNWFCYEFACTFFEHLKDNKDKKLKKWLFVRTELQVAEFCAYYAKRLKKSMEDRLAGITDGTEFDEEFISDFCHTNTHNENMALIEVVVKAWDEHTLFCVSCPTRCVSERYAKCEFFDRMERGGYFS